jgi:hypothetical protein
LERVEVVEMAFQIQEVLAEQHLLVQQFHAQEDQVALIKLLELARQVVLLFL